MTSIFTEEQQAELQKRHSETNSGNLNIIAAAHVPAWLVSPGPPLSDSQLSPCSGNASDNEDGTVRGTGSPGGIKNGRARYLEKNRVAQARFRQRQKERHSQTEQSMVELQAAFRQLQAERDSLVAKADHLEQCLRGQQQLQRSGRQVQSSGTSIPLQWERQSSATTISEVDGTGKLQQPGPQGSGPKLLNGAPYPTTWNDISAWYKGIVEDLAKLCGCQEDAQAQAAADAQLERLWMEVTGVMFSTMVNDEAMRRRIFTLPLLPNAQPPESLPGREFWCSVTEALEVTPQQCTQMVRVRQDFLLAIRAVARERHALTCVMQAIVPGFEANVDVATEHQKCMDTMAKLQANIRKEQLLNSKLGIDFYVHILSPLQGAKACVGLFPWLPDKLAILNCVAAAASQPSAANIVLGNDHTDCSYRP